MNEQRIDNFASDSNLAVNHTICYAFCAGETVQYLENGKWYDYHYGGHSEFFGPWCYRKDLVSWRVKPNTITIEYRVALMKGRNYYTLTADKNSNIGYTESEIEQRSDFVMWLEETVTKEIEIG